MKTPAVARSEQETSDGDKGRGVYHLFVWVSIALVVYVLGVGPAVKIAEGSSDPRLDEIIRVFYRPLIALTDHSKTAEKFFEWYVVSVWKVQ